MTSSSSLVLQHYIKLTEFLGKALGPDYEVALHDLTRKDRSIIAIANVVVGLKAEDADAALQQILCEERMATMYIQPDGTAVLPEDDGEEEEA